MPPPGLELEARDHTMTAESGDAGFLSGIVEIELLPKQGLPVTDIDLATSLPGPTDLAKYTLTDEGHYG